MMDSLIVAGGHIISRPHPLPPSSPLLLPHPSVLGDDVPTAADVPTHYVTSARTESREERQGLIMKKLLKGESSERVANIPDGQSNTTPVDDCEDIQEANVVNSSLLIPPSSDADSSSSSQKQVSFFFG